MLGKKVEGARIARLPDGTPIAWDEPTVLDRAAGRFEFAVWKNVTILAWAAKVEGDAVPRLGRARQGIVGTYPDGRSVISVVGPGVDLPTAETRSAIVELMTRHADKMACLAIVVLGDGFKGAAQRSAHTSMRMDASREYEMGLLGSIEELEAWLPEHHAKRTRVNIDPAALGRIVRGVWADTVRSSDAE